MAAGSLIISQHPEAAGYWKRFGESGDVKLPPAVVMLTDTSPAARYLRLTRTCLVKYLCSSIGSKDVDTDSIEHQLDVALSPENQSLNSAASIVMAYSTSRKLGKIVVPYAQSLVEEIAPVGPLRESLTSEVSAVFPLVRAVEKATALYGIDLGADQLDCAIPLGEDPRLLGDAVMALENNLSLPPYRRM